MKSGEIAYEILSVRDFGIGMRRRNVKVQLLDYSPSRDQLMKITEIIWKEHGQDVEELTTVFFFARDGFQVSGLCVWVVSEGERVLSRTSLVPVPPCRELHSSLVKSLKSAILSRENWV